MTERQLTAFEHILLGMICMEPSSGYDLKRIFAATPMGVYQPSSGALYPALRRLEDRGLVRPQAPADESARQRRVYGPTEAGHEAHLGWLQTPVEAANVPRDLGLHLVRFVMMEHEVPPAAVLGFLRSLEAALAAFTAELERHMAAGDPGQRHPGLAVEHGLAVHQASLRWVRDTIAQLGTAS
jgi:PadR family transcriptional regulator AphA